MVYSLFSHLFFILNALQLGNIIGSLMITNKNVTYKIGYLWYKLEIVVVLKIQI